MSLCFLVKIVIKKVVMGVRKGSAFCLTWQHHGWRRLVECVLIRHFLQIFYDSLTPSSFFSGITFIREHHD